jgi:hypothetical protein
MKSVVGIFGARQGAERGARMLDSAGITRSRIAVLTPQGAEQEIAAVPTTDAEHPGMGIALRTAAAHGTPIFPTARRFRPPPQTHPNKRRPRSLYAWAAYSVLPAQTE